MNKEGVEYSMTQWFPKLCEFDHHGWHTNPYIGREFHGIWGNFDVHIHLPEGYGIGATGVKQSTTSSPMCSSREWPGMRSAIESNRAARAARRGASELVTTRQAPTNATNQGARRCCGRLRHGALHSREPADSTDP